MSYKMDFPRLSEKEYLILDQLRAGGERYGLEMVTESGGALRRGTIYVTLGRMVEKGYLSSRRESSPKDPGMPRRLYMITGEGQRALRVADAAMLAAKSGQFGGPGYA
ncbi:PadR family transcriptional regulator [Sagittula sp. P11]|uniref:PadR family transcriptional regulator n=1 Tax=Sagittula sp. P11 TaxID=2009329 RepID=UPI0012FD455F|nr:PadR family transcriptional regulator [Sagittula sp. P11]